MTIFELVTGLLLVGALLTGIARRFGVPYPALLALAGAGLALIPGLPEATLDPELALVLFVAPALLDAAYDASPRDLRDNWLSVTALVLVAVALTVVIVAVAARAVVPAMPWAVAIALGAIVAPPDAVAATAVLRQLSPPHRIMVVLEGESLLNDASALLIYRLAVGAAMTGSFSFGAAVPLLLLTCAGGLALGWGLARLYLRLVRVSDMSIAIVIQFLATFAVWTIADKLGLSPVITMVAYAMTLARTIPLSVSAEFRRASYAIWEVVVFVLNALAFILIGLQLRHVLLRMNGQTESYLLLIGAVLAGVIFGRIGIVMTYNAILRWKHRRFGMRARRPLMRPSVAGGLVISWCGMRGIVTLAAALALPDGAGGGTAFPYRDMLIATAFGVVLGTLVLQGLTLRPLLAALKLTDDGVVDREVGLARQAMAHAAITAIDRSGSSDAALVVRREYQVRLREMELEQSGIGGSSSDPTLRILFKAVVRAEREALADLRRREKIGDEAFHRVEEELDWAEVHARRGAW